MTSANISSAFGQVTPVSSMNVKATEKSDVDFSSMMTKSLDQMDTNLTGKETLSAENVSSQSDNTKDTSQTVDDSYKFDNSKSRDNIKDAKEVEEPDEETIEEVSEAVEDFTNEVKNLIEEKFNISEDEITDAMETLGLTAMDLLNPGNMAKLLTELTGQEDTTGLILSDSFTELMTDVSELGTDLTENLGMDLKEVVSLMDAVEETLLEDFTELPVIENPVSETSDFAETTETLVEPEAETVSQPVEEETFASEVVEDETVETFTEEPVEKTPKEDQVITSDQTEEDIIEADLSKKPEESTNSNENQGKQNSFENREAEPEARFTFENSSLSEMKPVFEESLSSVESYTTIDPADLVDQLIDKASVTLNDEVTTMQMELNPESLGKLYLEVSSDKEGNVTAKLVAENENVKNALESQLALVQEKLNAQGTKVNAVEVSVGTHEFEQNLEQDAASQNERNLSEEQQRESQGQHGRTRNINLNSLDELQGLMTEEEQLVAQIMQDNGNTVNLTA